jgi:hypothetical protein
LVQVGALGLAGCLFLLALPSFSGGEEWEHLLGTEGSRIVLVCSGFFAGLFALPVQVYLQARPPQNVKGRVIGAMNLVNWIAIVVAAYFFFATDHIFKELDLPKFGIFGITGLILLPIAFFYRSDKVELLPETDARPG